MCESGLCENYDVWLGFSNILFHIMPMLAQAINIQVQDAQAVNIAPLLGLAVGQICAGGVKGVGIRHVRVGLLFVSMHLLLLLMGGGHLGQKSSNVQLFQPAHNASLFLGGLFDGMGADLLAPAFGVGIGCRPRLRWRGCDRRSLG
jgi:hypothetical protein